MRTISTAGFNPLTGETVAMLSPLQEKLWTKTLPVALAEGHRVVEDVCHPGYRDSHGNPLVIVPQGTVIVRTQVIELVAIGMETVTVWTPSAEEVS